MSKMDALQSALNSTAKRRPQPVASAALAEQAGPTAVEKPKAEKKPVLTSREGKDNIAAWLPNEYKKSIRLVQAKRPGDPSLQELMAEAFNDLFAKYNVPTVSE